MHRTNRCLSDAISTLGVDHGFVVNGLLVAKHVAERTAGKWHTTRFRRFILNAVHHYLRTAIKINIVLPVLRSHRSATTLKLQI